ncbi:MAG TPA: hypothetical protein VHC67_00340 [Gaiellaceae bacterium]|nr:hypothetical protein [Gaiellaceae bacterium]
MELLVGRVISVSDHPGARGPSFLLEVDLGGRGVRQAQIEPGDYANGPRLVRPDGAVEPGTPVA